MRARIEIGRVKLTCRTFEGHGQHSLGGDDGTWGFWVGL